MGKIMSMMNRKAVAQWISWVVLFTFVVFLGAIIAYWMKDYTIETKEDLIKRTHTSEYCDLVGIDISDLISADPETLSMNITNTYDLAVNKLIFRLYDANNNVVVNAANITIKPGQSKIVRVPQNITTTIVEVVPVIIDSEEEIICTERAVQKGVG